MSVAEVEEGHREGLTSAEREELVRLRRELRVARMEVETLKRASAYFARENVLPKDCPLVAKLAASGHDVTVACRSSPLRSRI